MNSHFQAESESPAPIKTERKATDSLREQLLQEKTAAQEALLSCARGSAAERAAWARYLDARRGLERLAPIRD